MFIQLILVAFNKVLIDFTDRKNKEWYLTRSGSHETERYSFLFKNISFGFPNPIVSKTETRHYTFGVFHSQQIAL